MTNWEQETIQKERLKRWQVLDINIQQFYDNF